MLRLGRKPNAIRKRYCPDQRPARGERGVRSAAGGVHEFDFAGAWILLDDALESPRKRGAEAGAQGPGCPSAGRSGSYSGIYAAGGELRDGEASQVSQEGDAGEAAYADPGGG